MTFNATISTLRSVMMALALGSMLFSAAPAPAQVRQDLGSIKPNVRPALTPIVRITGKQFIGLDNSVGAYPQFQVEWTVTNSPNTEILGFTISMEGPRESGGVATSVVSTLPASARSKVVTVRFFDSAPLDPAGPLTITLTTTFRQNGLTRTITTTAQTSI